MTGRQATAGGQATMGGATAGFGGELGGEPTDLPKTFDLMWERPSPGNAMPSLL